MRSFRLDGGSVARFFDSWPAWLAGALLGGLCVYFGLTHLWGVVVGVILGGVYGGYLLRGVASKQLRDRYPNARYHGLLSIGMATLMLGIATRMALPQVQGSGFDLAWLGISFASILAFVIANRKDADVFR